jgi:hypothetical protein
MFQMDRTINLLPISITKTKLVGMFCRTYQKKKYKCFVLLLPWGNLHKHKVRVEATYHHLHDSQGFSGARFHLRGKTRLLDKYNRATYAS